MTAYDHQVTEAARVMWFSGVRQWPLRPMPEALQRFTLFVLDEAWEQIRTHRRRAGVMGRRETQSMDLGERMDAAGVTAYELSKVMDVSNDTARKWALGVCKPSPAYYARIVAYLETKEAE